MKKAILAALGVFLTWAVMDAVIHGVMLGSLYAATPELWRPMGEMKMGLSWFVALVSAGCFVYVYAFLITDRSLRKALTYGAVFGLGAGSSMGYGSYSYMPIPYTLALSWFLATIAEAVAGAAVAWVILGRGAQTGH